MNTARCYDCELYGPCAPHTGCANEEPNQPYDEADRIWSSVLSHLLCFGLGMFTTGLIVAVAKA